MLHITPILTAYILTLTFFLGCCLGSFTDCLAMRLLSGESVLHGRSHCDSCGYGGVFLCGAFVGSRLLHGSVLL